MSSRRIKQLIGSVLIVFALVVTADPPALAYFLPLNGQAATRVLGQPNFTSAGAASTQAGMNSPQGVAVDPLSHKVFVADYYNNRVLRFASTGALANGAPAEAVLGQPDFTGNTAHPSQNGMDWPAGLSVDAAGRLWVADWSNNRVLRFDNAAAKADGANADGVLGQPDFTSNTGLTTRSGMYNPSGVFADAGGRLWVVDYQNSRVLRFDNAASKANGANADGVLGQPDYTSNGMATTQNTMCYPFGLFVDSAGRLWVADEYNMRVLRFDNAASKANGANADGVLGQADFNSKPAATTRNGMDYPTSVSVDNASGRLYVSDIGANRILVFNSAATLAAGANASSVLGQTDFTTGTANSGGLSAAGLSSPYGVFYDPLGKVLLAADTGNNRVLMYGRPSRYFSASSAAAADGWVLESNKTSSVGGSLSATGALRVGDDAGDRQFRSVLSFDSSALPDNAMIRAVTLRIKKAGMVGSSDPLGTFGTLLVDIKTGNFGAAPLQATDFQASASASGLGHFGAIGSGWYQLVLPASDFGFVNLAGVTQFRVRFSLPDDNNHSANFDTFFAGNAASAADRPRLSVEYTLP